MSGTQGLAGELKSVTPSEGRNKRSDVTTGNVTNGTLFLMVKQTEENCWKDLLKSPQNA